MCADSFRFKVGELTCLAVSDGSYVLQAENLFCNAPQDELDEAMSRYGHTSGEVPVEENCLLVQSGEETVLIDTGMGPGLRPDAGRLLSNLQAEGIDPSDIDTVLPTHAHGDHVGGLTDAHGDLAFPRARFVMCKDEWDFCMPEGARAGIEPERGEFLEAKLGPIRSRIDLLAGESEIAPGVRTVAAAGHTPGHLMVEIQWRGRRLLYISDAVLHPINLSHPDWHSVYDRDAEQALAVRHSLLERAEAEDLLILAFHFAFPGLGYIGREGAAWKWEPVLA
jgi:glyoxylase-like metal-dependent hydrolase (beta-lactamase superfamily II)